MVLLLYSTQKAASSASSSSSSLERGKTGELHHRVCVYVGYRKGNQSPGGDIFTWQQCGMETTKDGWLLLPLLPLLSAGRRREGETTAMYYTCRNRARRLLRCITCACCALWSASADRMLLAKDDDPKETKTATNNIGSLSISDK